MDPVWAAIAEFWWVGPTVIGAGALSWIGVRRQRTAGARRLAYDAARQELRQARAHADATRIDVRVARAELARVQAERTARHASSAEVADARRVLQTAQREARAAAATVRAHRTHVSIARAAVPASSEASGLPLAKLIATHDGVTARWMEYETDPARLIAFPAMSDGRAPATAAYLTARAEAQRLRPASPLARMTPTTFTQYRDAVTHLVRTFDAAEREAWRQARASGAVPATAEGPDGAEPDAPSYGAAAWSAVAQQAIARSGEVIARASEAAAAALEARLAPRNPGDSRDPGDPGDPDRRRNGRPGDRR